MSMSRKQQELLKREALITTEAARLLDSEGYFGFSLDKLAQAIGYAKGTIYQHFKTKEDIILAIAAQSMDERVRLFKSAARFSGNPREKMTAINIADRLFVQLNPAHFQVEHLIKSRSLWAKTSSIRQSHLESAEGECGSSVAGIIEEALNSGELVLKNSSAAEVAFGLWTMSLGVHSLASATGLVGAPNLEKFGIDKPYDSLWRNQLAFLDGLGWEPLSSKWDYTQTRNRVLKEIFDEERQKTKET